jgi:hypothetical protein
MIAELHDGRKLEFPDGTDPAVVQATVKKVLGSTPAPTSGGVVGTMTSEEAGAYDPAPGVAHVSGLQPSERARMLKARDTVTEPRHAGSGLTNYGASYAPPVPQPYVPSVSPAPPMNLQQNAGIGPQLKELGGIVAPAIAPTILGGLGAYGGRTFGVPGMVTGGALGAGGGEWLNQQLGITPPSKAAIGVQAALPPAVQGLAGVARAVAPKILKYIPGASGGLHEAAAIEAAKAPSKIGVGLRASDDVYADLAQAGNPPIAVTRMGQAAQDIGAIEARKLPSMKNTALEKLTNDLSTQASRTAIPFQDVQLSLKWLNNKIRETRAAGGEEHGAYQKILQALQDDISDAARAGVPAAKLLKEANLSYKMEMAKEELEHWITKATNFGRNGDKLIGFSPSQVLNKLEKDPYFAKRFQHAPQELQDVKDTFRELTTWAIAQKPPKGVQFGSGPTNQRAAMGYAVGGPAGAAILANAPGVIAAAMLTRPGRAMIRTLVNRPGFSMDSSRLGMIAAATGGALGNSDVANDLKAVIEPPPAPPAPEPAKAPAPEKKKGRTVTKKFLRDERGRLSGVEETHSE